MQNSLPANLEAERHMLGQCILDGKLVNRELSTTDFYLHGHQQIWSAICELDENGAEIDALTISELLKENGVKQISVPQLSELTYGLVYAFKPADWVADLKRYALRRHLLRVLSIQMVKLETDSDTGEVLRTLEAMVDEARTDLSEKDERFVSFADVMDFEVKPALERLLSPDDSEKISTGFPVIDKMIGGGLSLSDVVVVGSTTGSGKSAFVLQLAQNIAKGGVPVAFLSGEMSNRENGLRAVSQEAEMFNLNSCTWLQESGYNQAMTAVEKLRDLPVYIDHKTLDTLTLRSHIRALVREKGVRVLVIDYLQLLKLGGRDPKTRHEKVTEVSQEIKRLAIEFNICVIQVVQFNREGSKSGKSTIHDFEASGQIEKDASIIILIDQDKESGTTTLRFEKGRNTGEFEVRGRFKGEHLKFHLE